MRCAVPRLVVILLLPCVLVSPATADPFQQVQPGSPEAKAAREAATRPADAATALRATLPEVKLQQTPLSDAMDGLRDLTGVNISVNEAALTAAGVPRAAPVTFEGKQLTLAEALDGILKPLADKGVTFLHDEENIYVSTTGDLEQLAKFRERHAAFLAADNLANPRLVVAEGDDTKGPSLRFDMPPVRLKAALAELSRRGGVEIRSNPDELAKAGVPARQVIRLHLRNPTLGDALTHVLWKTGQIHKLDLKAEGKTITIVPREKPDAA